MNTKRWLVMVMLLVLVGASCAKKSTTDAAPTTSSPSASPSALIPAPFNEHGSKDVTGATSTILEVDNFYFAPSILRGRPGEKLKLEISNDAKVPHNFTLSDQHINQDLAPGQKVSVTVTFPMTGSLLFHCEYHESRGMKGALTT